MKRCLGPFYELVRLPPLAKADYWELASRKLIAKDSKGNDYFIQAGVFSTKKAIYVVVPWFLRNQNEGEDPVPSSLLQSYSSLRWFKQLLDTSLGSQSDTSTGREFVLAAMYFAMKELIERGMRFNVFRQETQTINAIKGKWHIEQDIRRNHFPVSFVCTIDECDTRHPILATALAFCDNFLAIARSQALQRSITELRYRLSQLVSAPEDLVATISDAKNLALRDRRFAPWIEWLSAAESALVHDGKNEALVDSALMDDFVFDTANFFEEAVLRILQDGCGFVAKPQESDQLLGGAFWNEASDQQGPEELFRESNARQRSRPDYLVSAQSGKTLLVECKYKRLVPTVTGSGSRKTIRLTGLQRDDRNQLLSFVLSKSKKLEFKSDAIIVLYPMVEHEEALTYVPRLTFRADQVLKGEVASVSWERNSNRKGVSICFLGISLTRAMKALESGDKNDPELVRIRTFLTNLSEAA